MLKSRTISLFIFILASGTTGVAASECETDVSACSIKELCSAATIIKRNHLEWNFDALDHVVSAKSYGLNCGVDKPVKPVEDQVGVQAKFKKNDFTSLNQLKRHQIQYALKRLGYYSSGVDGLWGKGTERAVNKFMLDENIKTNLATNVYKALISTVDVSKVALKPVVKKNPKKIKNTTITLKDDDTKICILNTKRTAFEQMLTGEGFIQSTVKALTSLKEIKISNGKMLIGNKKITPKGDDETYSYFVQARCVENMNNWSRCGTFVARAILRKKDDNTVKGKLLLPSQWALYTGQQHKLEYTCS